MKRSTLTALVVAVLLSTAGLAPASILTPSQHRNAMDDLRDGARTPLQPAFSSASGDHSDQAAIQEMGKKKKKKKKGKAS